MIYLTDGWLTWYMICSSRWLANVVYAMSNRWLINVVYDMF